MRSFLFLVAVLLLRSATGQTFAGEAQSAETLIKNAVSHTLRSAFKAELFYPGTGRTIATYAQNGNFRIEYISPNHYPPIRTVILRRAYSFDITRWVQNLGDDSIRGDSFMRWNYTFSDILHQIERLAEKNRFASGTYKYAGSAHHHGMSCVRVMIAYPYADEDISRAHAADFMISLTPMYGSLEPGLFERHLTPDEFSKAPEQYIASYYAAAEVLINDNPQNPFIHQIKYFNRNGEVVHPLDWGRVQFTDDIPAEMFIIPQGYAITVHENQGEWADDFIKKIGDGRKPPPSSLERLGQWFGGVFTGIGRFLSSSAKWVYESTLATPPAVLLIPAAVCIPAAVAIKRKRDKNKNHGPAKRSAGHRR